jgi:hypothetical protein
MSQHKFKVYYLPFPLSDVEAEIVLYASDEADARQVFERIYPGFSFKSAEETS